MMSRPYSLCVLSLVVSSCWSVLDPKIAAWLLNSDHPTVTFQQTCKVFLGPAELTEVS